LAAGIFLIVTVYQSHRITALDSTEIMAIVVTVLLFVGTVAAGGLLSIDKPIPVAVAMIHQWFPYLIVFSTAVTLYLLLSRR